MNIARQSVSPLRRHAISLALVAAGIAGFSLWWASPAAAATFTVNSANDVDDTACDGVHCSLREAINAANAAAGLDTITFNIAGSGVHTITPATALPTITDPVVIDGYTQPGASANTLATGNDAVVLIELDGSSAGTVNGLTVSGGGSTIRGLVINGFTNHGIELTTAGSNLIEGNFIGTNPAGSAADGNSGAGVFVNSVSANTIGGTTPAARNLISGNNVNTSIGFSGIDITGTGNFVQGNYLGTNAGGTAAIPNLRGGVIVRNNGNTIGGTGSGAGNLVSGNSDHGVDLFGASNSVVQGNLVGTNAAGTADLGNARDGVRVLIGSNNTIGGTAAGASNVISGNGWAGVHLFGSSTTLSTVRGNFIGTNAAGTAGLGNTERGVFIDGSPNNTIGGTDAGARNFISGNVTHGVEISGAAATGNTVLGNYIGTNAVGAAAVGNSGAGVFVNGASNNTIGGTTSAARNVISGNNVNTSIGFAGIDITGTGNFVQGNYLGTNAAGTAAIPNKRDGILVRNNGNTVGGSAAGAGNLISGNTEYGVNIFGASNNTVQGNLVGTDATGTADLGNGRAGVRVLIGSNNTIGGTTAGAGNVISGNGWSGIHLFGGSTTLTTVQGNLIGTNAAGTAMLGNSERGIFVDASPNNAIGGTATGDRNIISGNNLDGIRISGTGASGNTIQGNYIGTDVTGALDFGNASDGVHILEGTNNAIGGTAAGARNVISGNTGDGVRTAGVNGATIQGNYIGTNAAGDAGIGNGGEGVHVSGSANIMAGGAAAGAGNVISANGLAGVQVEGCCGTNTLQGNYIGTDAAGTGALGNPHGVVIFSSSAQVGGTAAGAGNVISGNNDNGLIVAGSLTTVQGNYIGTDLTGAEDLGNGSRGVVVTTGSNTIGGTAVGAGNVISGNTLSGLEIQGAGSSGNTVQGNYIGTDASGTAALGNSLEGVFLNEAPSNTVGGTAVGAGNVISGNGSDGVRILGLVGGGSNTIQGNYIGTDAAGTVAVGNAGSGVVVDFASYTVLGGVGGGNVISGNGAEGVILNGTVNTGVWDNYIGTDAGGVEDLGNSSHGVLIDAGVGNFIGGTLEGLANTIAFNEGVGVGVTNPYLNQHRIRGNSIHSNNGLGIDLGNDGVTANDPGDGDGGPNELQNFPELTGVFGAGASTTIEGTLNSTANTDFDLDFYENDECDPARHGEGQSYLGSFAVSTDGNGDASFSETVPGSVAAGQFVTGTATDPNGNTSEFSLCNPPPTLVVINTDDSGAGSLRAAIASANASPGPDTIEFDIPGVDYTIDLASALPVITDPVVIDGTTQPGFSGSPIVELNGAGAGSTADGLRILAGDSTVMGLVVNGFGGDGIELNGGDGNTIRGNYLGTDVTGTSDLGNTVGLRIVNSANNFIGGSSAGMGNLISGNSGRGVALLGATSTGNVIRGNLIGTDAAGTADLGNGVHGISISMSSSNTIIGGQGPNTIAFNGDDGVWIGAGTGNRVLRNSIHSNGGLGIDLGVDGVTANDTGDEDTGANMLQNFPALDAALVGGGATAVFGTLESAADTDYRLHFWHNAACDTSGNGEGETYLGSRLVSTDGDGLASFRATFAQVGQNRHVTAVAVDPAGNTSEFSGCEPTTLRPTLAISDVTVGEGNSGTTPATFTVTRSGNTGGSSSVNFATANVTAVAPGDYTTISGTVSFGAGETTKTITVNVVGDTLDEANETFRVNLSAPVDATISDSQGVGTITDDDPAPTMSINDVSVVEPDSGTNKAIFTVTLSAASAQTVTVNFSTADGTATAPADYTATSGTLSFAPGVTTRTIQVLAKGENLVEPNETFFVNLTAPTNATFGDNQGQGTIQNDD